MMEFLYPKAAGRVWSGAAGRIGLLLAMLILLGVSVSAQCVATFTNAAGTGRWDDAANWTIEPKAGGTGCTHGSIGSLMSAMATPGAGNGGNEVVIAGEVKPNTGQPVYAIFDNLKVEDGAKLSIPPGGMTSLREGGLMDVEGELDILGDLQLNFKFPTDPPSPEPSRIEVAETGDVGLFGDFLLNNTSCEGGTVSVDGYMVIGGSIGGRQTCPPGTEPITGTGSVDLGGGCNDDTDKDACGDLCLDGKCPGGTLPVKLLNYSVTVVDGIVQLQWQTASEQNNSHFVLRRMNQYGQSEKVAEVKGAGTASMEQFYRFEDADAPEGLLYYLLEQYDYDGKRTSLGVREVFVMKRGQLVLHPNPASGGQQVHGQLPPHVQGTRGLLQVMNTGGNLIYQAPINDVHFTFPAPMATGIYYVRVQAGVAGYYAGKLVVQ